MSDEKAASTTPLTIMGVLMIVFGILAIATPAVAGKAVVMIIGAVLLLVGIVQIVSGLRTEGWSRKLPPLILGVIAAVCGLGLLGEPWVGMKFIALLLAIFFVMEGIWKIVASFSYRPASGWLLMLAVVAVGLIRRQWALPALGVSLFLLGHAMEYDIANIVDPHFTVAAKIGKEYLREK